MSALPVERALEPPLVATPEAVCGPGSRPETGIQGRVSRADHESGRAAEGYTCNTELVGSFEKPNPIGSIGGFKVERYVDSSGHDCAYYDTTLLAPTNIFDGEAGVNVLDMSNPAKPVLTDRLVTPAMDSPHESLVLNQKRGLLAAVLGNATFYPGLVDIYDISADCRHPVLKSSSPVGAFGHESGMSPDGRTFYSASPSTETIVAVDISNPSLPQPLWVGPYDSHGLSISDDGNRAYVAGTGSGLIILDVSEIQARKPNPQVREISRLTWTSMSIPQNALPVTIDGHPYVVEIDEFGAQDEVGAGRIIDIADEANPRVVSNLRLDVHQPENFDAQAMDPQAQSPLQGYAGHYCNVPQRTDPGIVACSMILSGLRIFDIRDPNNPKEIAYFNAPIDDRVTPGFEASNWAMSSPSFVPERGEIWYSDGFQGFFAVKVTNGVWPFRLGTEWIALRRARDDDRGATAKTNSRHEGADVIRGRKGSGSDHRRRRAATRSAARQAATASRAGTGRDRLRGAKGRDRLVGGPGRDRLHCGPGTPRCRGRGTTRPRARLREAPLDLADAETQAELVDRVALGAQLVDRGVDALAREVGDLEALDDRVLTARAGAGEAADDSLVDLVGAVGGHPHRDPVAVGSAQDPVVDVIDRGVGGRSCARGAAGIDDLGAALADSRDVLVGDPGLVVDRVPGRACRRPRR